MFPDSPMRHPSRQQQQQQQRTTVATARTLLVVFQRGRQIWSQGASLATLGEEVRTIGRPALFQWLLLPACLPVHTPLLLLSCQLVFAQSLLHCCLAVGEHVASTSSVRVLLGSSRQCRLN
jgi:hypothetical protein